MSKSEKRKNEERQEARVNLLELLKPGDTVWTVVRHVARSGMSRRIDCYLMQDGEPRYLSGWVAQALGWTRHRDSGAIVVQGCGMDMGFHLVYSLSRALFPEGFGCIGEAREERRSCPSNDHSNGDRNYTPHTVSGGLYSPGDTHLLSGRKATPENGAHWHREGGYALRHRRL